MLLKSIGFAIILLVTIAFGIVLPDAPLSAGPAPMHSFSGGTVEASSVAHVPNTDAVLFVDDGRANEVFLMRIGEDRKHHLAAPAFGVLSSMNPATRFF